MKNLTKITLLLSLGLGVIALLTTPAFSADDAGKDEFLAQGCNKCHSVSTQDIEATIKSEKMRGPDLATAEDHEAAWIVQYVNKEVQLNDKDHKAPFKGTAEQLETVANWVASLK